MNEMNAAVLHLPGMPGYIRPGSIYARQASKDAFALLHVVDFQVTLTKLGQACGKPPLGRSTTMSRVRACLLLAERYGSMCGTTLHVICYTIEPVFACCRAAHQCQAATVLGGVAHQQHRACSMCWSRNFAAATSGNEHGPPRQGSGRRQPQRDQRGPAISPMPPYNREQDNLAQHWRRCDGSHTENGMHAQFCTNPSPY